MRWLWRELSPKEKQACLLRVIDGLPYKQLADELGVSRSHVKNVMNAIYRLMGLRGIVHLAFEMGKHNREVRAWRKPKKGKK